MILACNRAIGPQWRASLRDCASARETRAGRVLGCAGIFLDFIGIGFRSLYRYIGSKIYFCYFLAMKWRFIYFAEGVLYIFDLL
jgi:hypothetical protein